jgi:acyl-CoA thioesterase II
VREHVEAAGSGSTDLRHILALEESAPDRWEAPSPVTDRPTLFGGQVAAQALLAAGLTRPPGTVPHSLHCYFLRGGLPGVPVSLHVDRLRDGRSFAARQVVALQDGAPILTAACLFHRPETSRTLRMEHDDAPPPERCHPSPRGPESENAFELREIPAEPADVAAGRLRLWIRARGAPPETPDERAAVVAFLSDLRTGTAVAVGLGGFDDVGMMVSLDHGLWLHEDPAVDRWMLMEVRTLSYAGARGHVLGTLRSEEGDLVATFTQELVIRSARARGAG